MVPLCRKLIDTSQLSQEEKVWIDGYHATIYEKTKGALDGPALKWLERETQKYA